MDGVFCANDEMAKGLYKEMMRRGLVVGKDISIFGYDDSIVAASSVPPMASVRADSWKMGAESLRIVVDLLHGKEAKFGKL